MTQQLISLTINNKQYEVRANASILQACEEIGVHLPRFCYHEKLSVAGNCRICLVEVEKSPKPVVSCAMPVSKGMVIYTDTPLVKKVRESVLEFLLINHPLDCPICDQGGECDLQDETLQFGSDRGCFYEFKRSVEDKEVGPIIKTIMTRCIHCTRCVRFSAEIAGQEVMGSFGRGEETEIGTYVQEFIKTELSGNLADVCPVGALTSKPYAYRARSWELQKVETVDFFDSLCTDIEVQTRQFTSPIFASGQVKTVTKEEIVRILPRANGIYEDNWISDKTRYAFDGLRKQRLTLPQVKNSLYQTTNPLLEDILVDLTYKMFFKASSNKKNTGVKIGAVVDSLIDLEGLYLMVLALKNAGSSDIQCGNVQSSINFDVASYYTFNRSVSSFNELTSVLMIGVNTRFETSILNTTLRKHQLARDLTYVTLGVYANLKLKQNHLGISAKNLLKILNNSVGTTKDLVLTKGSSVFLGSEILKSKNGAVLQNLVRILGKNLFLKTPTGERLGVLQGTSTNLIFNHLGVAPGVRSTLNVPEISDKKYELLYTVQPYQLSPKKWLSSLVYTHVVSFATHKPFNFNSDTYIPMKTFYEKDGYLVNLEGRLRKFYTAVTAPKSILSLETFFTSLLRAKTLPSNWLTTLKEIWRFNEEILVNKNIEKIMLFPNNFFYNYSEPAVYLINVPFSKTIADFYSNDLLSENSLTMKESSLFLNQRRNFSSK